MLRWRAPPAFSSPAPTPHCAGPSRWQPRPRRAGAAGAGAAEPPQKEPLLRAPLPDLPFGRS
eukprot:scaffold1990_cov350-Prasinococcus_capsulatus_cf.AAC.7